MHLDAAAAQNQATVPRLDFFEAGRSALNLPIVDYNFFSETAPECLSPECQQQGLGRATYFLCPASKDTENNSGK